MFQITVEVIIANKSKLEEAKKLEKDLSGLMLWHWRSAKCKLKKRSTESLHKTHYVLAMRPNFSILGS